MYSIQIWDYMGRVVGPKPLKEGALQYSLGATISDVEVETVPALLGVEFLSPSSIASQYTESCARSQKVSLLW